MTTSPFSYLTAAGPAAAPVTRLAWGLGAVSVATVVIIALLLAAGIWRRRASLADGHALAVTGPPGTGMAWIYGGLAVSIPVLAACTVWVLLVLAQVMHPARAPVLTLQVTAHQWWWEVRYLDPAGGETFVTANEIHIPAGQPVRVELTSQDVIHSFWVPRLGGKMDVIPGVKNVTWIEADRPGSYQGECGEFCGLQHARMNFIVIADAPGGFAHWRAGQLASPSTLSPDDRLRGEGVFLSRCGSCHTIAGTPAGGLDGPDLSHLATRTSLAAGLIPNDPGHLLAWIEDPQAIKPGARMPQVPMSRADREALVVYLRSLN